MNVKAVDELKKSTHKLKGPVVLEEHVTMGGKAYVKVKQEAEGFAEKAPAFLASSNELFKKLILSSKQVVADSNTLSGSIDVMCENMRQIGDIFKTTDSQRMVYIY